MFNMQSGLYRQSFPNRGLKKAFKGNGAKHSKAVTGVAIDGLNQVVISCGLDGKVKVRFSNPFPCSIRLIVLNHSVLGLHLGITCQ